MKRIIYLSITAIVAMTLNACDKDDPGADNPTNGKTTAVFNSDKTYGTMTDQDGNVYKTITIGTKTWMAENLRTAKYRDGSDIPEVTGDDAWHDLVTGAYCNFDNTLSIDSIATYGRLYNWYAVSDSRNLAPKGWHVATDDEWSELTDEVGGSAVAGSKLKEAGLTHWTDPNEGATNESGFTAIPGGKRYSDGSFNDIGKHGAWWTATASGASYVWLRYLNYGSTDIDVDSDFKECGLAVRCVRD